MADTRVNHYCNIQDITRYLRPGKTGSAITPSSISSTSVTFATAAAASALVPGDVLKLTSAEAPEGEYREVIDVVGTTITLASAIAHTYTTTLSVVPQSLFTVSSTPSSMDVLDMIQDAEEEIERYTGKAWRLKTITEEYHDIPTEYYQIYKGRIVQLNHWPVLTDSSDGLTSGTDKIEIFQNGSWTDWVATKTAGRNNDYWVNSTDGRLFLKYQIPIPHVEAIRVTYRYGHVDSSNNPNPSRDIRKACAKMVAAEIMEMEPVLVNLVTGDDSVSQKDRAEALREDAFRILDMYKRWVVI